MNNNKLNEEMFECKMYITDLETDRKSKEINVQDLVFDDYIEFEFGDYEDEDYLQLPYNDFKFFINDYSVTFYSPQYHKLQSNWNSLREYTEARLKVLERRLNTFGTCNPDKDTKVLQIYQEYLDKMNELEGKDKEMKEDKKIEKIPAFVIKVGTVDDGNIEKYTHMLFEQQEELYLKLNELIDKVNSLENK